MVSTGERSFSMEMDELIPVDQFFEEYVSRLQQSAYSEEVNPYAVGGVHRRPSNIRLDPPATSEQNMSQPNEHFASASNPPANYTSTFMEPEGHHGGLLDAVRTDSLSLSRAMLTTPNYNGEQQIGHTPGQDPYMTSSTMTPYSDTVFGAATQPQTQQHYAPFIKQPLSAYEPMAMGTTDGIDRQTGVKKSRQKTVRQQQLNKLAQQRYRERKKAKTAGLQQTVDALTDELTRLTAVKEEKKELEERNASLERQLIEKEAELQSLKTEIEELKKTGGNNSPDITNNVHETRRAEPVGLNSRPAKLFHKKVKDLQQYLKANNLDPSLLTNPLDDSIPKKTVDDIYHLVGDVCMTCMQLTRYDGPDLWELISASLDSKQRESHDRVMWRGIARSLKLGKEQITSALNLRELHLAKLEKLYIQRQTLNLEAIQHLLPADQGGRAPTTTPLGCFNIASFVQRLRHSAKLNSVLDRLKENLRKEQKANSELEYLTFYRVMSPLQGAWFTVSAYPHQCDCLEFLNAVHDLYSRQSSESTKMITEA